MTPFHQEGSNIQKKTNPFIEGLKRNMNQQLTVVIHTPDGIIKLAGKCVGIDYAQKAIIIQDKNYEYMIKNYLYLERPIQVVGDE